MHLERFPLINGKRCLNQIFCLFLSHKLSSFAIHAGDNLPLTFIPQYSYIITHVSCPKYCLLLIYTYMMQTCTYIYACTLQILSSKETKILMPNRNVDKLYTEHKLSTMNLRCFSTATATEDDVTSLSIVSLNCSWGPQFDKVNMQIEVIPPSWLFPAEISN